MNFRARNQLICMCMQSFYFRNRRLVGTSCGKSNSKRGMDGFLRRTSRRSAHASRSRYAAPLAGKPSRNPNQEALFTFFVVKKHVNTRFFNRRQKPKPGTVVDNFITLPERTEFYIVSQSVCQGMVSPSAFNIIYDTCGLKINPPQMLTFKHPSLLQLVRNDPGPDGVPVCPQASLPRRISRTKSPGRKPLAIFCSLSLLLPFLGTMAWRSRGLTNAELFRQLQDHGIIKSERVAQALIATDRKHYVAGNLNPYIDSPQRIGHSATISAPHMHAYALELLEKNLRSDSKVLDVGSGSGYLTACFARYIHQKEGATGFVVGIEHHPQLVALGRSNIKADDESLLETGKIILIEGDGRKGCPEHAPYDCIHVGAAAPQTPQELINQLKPGGRMIVPVGPEDGTQYLEQYDKDSDGKVSKTRLMGVMYVPLTDLQT